jgi:hypothetical protein
VVDLLADSQAIVSQYLRSRSEITALVAQRVYSHIPRGNDGTADPSKFPLLLITRVSGSPVYSVPFFFDAPLFQFDAYGGSTAQAWTIAATAQAVLTELPSYDTALGQVTGVQFGFFAQQDDTDFSPPKPRWRFDCTVYVRSPSSVA